MTRAALLSIILLPLFAFDARPDVLLLRGGGRVEGIVTEVFGGYRVETIHGRATVRKDRVVGVVEGPYLTEIYAERLAKTDAADSEARFRLALWCEGMDLPRQAGEHLRETLLLDPDHLRARTKLGYVRFEGIWMMPDEAKQAAMASAGLIPFEDKWFSEAGLRAYLLAKEEQVRVEESAARQRAETEKAELEAEAALEELKRREAERKAAEQALARLEADRLERERLRREVDALRDLLQDIYYRGSLGLTGYGYAYGVPTGVGGRWCSGRYRSGRYGPGRYGSGRYRGSGLTFEWSRGNFRIRGRVR